MQYIYIILCWKFPLEGLKLLCLEQQKHPRYQPNERLHQASGSLTYALWNSLQDTSQEHADPASWSVDSSCNIFSFKHIFIIQQGLC